MKTPQTSPRWFQSYRKASPGFSLVEMMVVIMIISILMTAGIMGLKNLSGGKGTSSAIATCEALFSEARTIAMSKRCKSRVMVDIDDPDSENYLQRVVIAHQKINDDGTVADDQWVLSSRAYILPGGTYYSREYSKKEDGSPIDEANMSGENFSARYAGNYAFYEFNSEGICTDSGSSFIIGSGIRPKGQEPRFIKDAELDVAGFVIWKNGGTSAYRNPDHMNIDISEKFF